MGKSEKGQNVQTLYNFVSSYGMKPIIDMVVRQGARVAQMEALVQACALRDQDRWVRSLPVGQVLPNKPDEITILDTLREPLPQPSVNPSSDEHTVESSPVICAPGGAVSSTSQFLSVQDVLRMCGDSYADEDRVFPLLKRFFRRLVRVLLG